MKHTPPAQMPSSICFSRLGECDASTSISHPGQFQGYGRPWRANQAPVPAFNSERMTTNADEGRMKVQPGMELNHSAPSSVVPTGRQVNSRHAPTPQPGRLLGEEEEEEE